MIQFTSITKNQNGSWTWVWPATAAAYYRVVLFGVEIGTTTDPTFTWSNIKYAETAPPIEVVEEATLALSEANLSRLILQWYWVECFQFIVEEYLGGQWVYRQSIPNSGQWVYTIDTPLLADETEVDFRVRAADVLGNGGTPLVFKTYIGRSPNPPAIELDFDNDTTELIVTQGA